jgi:hypothetical protein
MRRSFARPSPAFKAALLAGVVALFAVSGGMLWFVGYNYDGLQGTPLTKIHPFTYWLFALALWRLLQSGAALRDWPVSSTPSPGRRCWRC